MKAYKKKICRLLVIVCVLYWLTSVGGFVRGMPYDFVQGVHKIIPWTTFDNYEKIIGEVRYYGDDGRPILHSIPITEKYIIALKWGEIRNGYIMDFVSSFDRVPDAISGVYMMNLETKEPVPIFYYKLIILSVIGVIRIVLKKRQRKIKVA